MEERETHTFEAIGTRWSLTVPQGVLSGERMEKVVARIGLFDQTYSRFREDSLVTEMATQAGVYTLPPDAQPLFDFYLSLYGHTKGLFTPLVGDVLSELGYDKDYSFVEKKPKIPPALSEVLEYDFPTLIIKQPTLLDFGAAGKGYLVDIISTLLKDMGITEGVVDAGGDIYHWGAESMRIGLEHPENTEQVIGIAEISNNSICGSAGNRRKWGGYTHIINPQTLQSPEEILSVWVVADTALLADGIATALFFVEPQTISSFYNFDYVILYKGYSAVTSTGFRGTLFT